MVRLVTLVGKHGREFEVEAESLRISSVILERSEESLIVNLDEVDDDTLGRIVEFMVHHAGNEPPIPEKPLRSKIMAEVLDDKWDADFIDRSNLGCNQDLYDLVIAANFLKINSLLHIGCAKIAATIKGRALEEIPNILDPNRPAPANA